MSFRYRVWESSVRTILATICLLAILGAANSAFAQETDVIYLQNGDRVTGEIKELDRGELRLTTNTFGTLYVKWADVERINSKKNIQLELIDGKRYFGPMEADKTPGLLTLIIAGEPVSIDVDRIIYMQPIKETEHLMGNLDSRLAIGFSYTSASDIMRWNINASTQYRTEKHLISGSYDSLITNNGTGTDSTRRDLTGNYYRFQANRWLWFGSGSYQQNDDLGVDGRVLASGGVGRYVSQSTSHEFLLAAGFAGNLENSTGSTVTGDDSEVSLEGLLFAEWNFFELYTPKSEVNVKLDYYPGISESDRHRGDLQVRYRQEFFKDLFWDLTYFHSFDTDPPIGAISENDYGLITGIEYKF